jgi:hypothetical protein
MDLSSSAHADVTSAPQLDGAYLIGAGQVVRRTLPLTLLLAASLASFARAQTIEIHLREDSTRVPIAGAIVRLLRETRPVAQALTDELGRVVLRAPGAGNYRLKIDRIGFSGMLTDPFALAEGEALRREVQMVSRRVQLPEIVVRSRSKCDPNETGGLAAALWEEIRKALTANVLTQQRRLPLHLREFVREVNLRGRALREWVVRSTLVRGRPFVSLPPAALAQSGFVFPVGDSTNFAAPDASLLLSDEFVATHCFRAASGKGPLVGLAFEPAPGRSLPDVAGTLWVDRASGELQFLEYGYTNVPGGLERAELGGRVEFRRLPGGAWIVGYWHIRAPRLVTTTVGESYSQRQVARLVGYIDHGGRADLAADGLGRVDRALIAGRVYDSTVGAGLAGAVVRVRGSPDSVLSDGQGRFELAVAASGDQVVSASHAKLGLLREPTSRAVLLSLGDTTLVQFAVPPVAAFVRASCGAPRDRSGLVGMAWRADGTPAATLTVWVKWLTAEGSRAAATRVGPKGLFVLCNLAPGPSLPVRLLDYGRLVLLEQPVRLAWREYRWIELREWGSPDSSVTRIPRDTAVAHRRF